MPFQLPPKSRLPSIHGPGHTSCGLLGGALRSLDADERREHLEYHARTCDDASGKMFAACPVCRPLRRQYVDIRIEEGSVRWFWFADGEHELGAVGESQDEVRERFLGRTRRDEGQETAVVLIDVPEDQLWAQTRIGAEAPSAREAADAAERATAGVAVISWMADRDSVWLLERYRS